MGVFAYLGVAKRRFQGRVNSMMRVDRRLQSLGQSYERSTRGMMRVDRETVAS
jgi:hypothetical protein